LAVPKVPIVARPSKWTNSPVFEALTEISKLAALSA
jgi:hypothetical protein